MLKRIIAGMISIVISAGMMTGCSDKTEYINKGQERTVSSSSSQTESVAEDKKETDKTYEILEKMSNEGAGVYEGDVTVIKENNEVKDKMRIKADIAKNGDIKIILTNVDKGKYLGFIYKNDTNNIYQISSQYKDSALTFVRSDYFGCIRNHLKYYAMASAVSQGILMISDDETCFKISFDNNTIYTLLCNVLDSVNSNYDEIYKLTKDDKNFMEFANEMIGDKYDTSLGLSSKAMNYLIDVMGVAFSRMFITETDSAFAGTILIDGNDNMATQVELIMKDITAEDTESVKLSISGKLTKTGDISDSVELPKNIITEIPDTDDSENEIIDDAPDKKDNSDNSSDESSSKDDTTSKNWTDDEFFN